MPFSFKPDIATENPQVGQNPPAPTSFGNPVAAAPTPVERPKGEETSIAGVILIALFGFTALIAGGLFAYKFYLSSQIKVKQEKLDGYENSLKNLPIEEMRKMSNRLKIVNQLIKDHPSVNVAFLIVEASVEHMITFNKFDLNYSENLKSYQLSLTGVAPDYKSIAQQLDTYKTKPYSTYILKPSLESLSPDTSGRILFSVKMPISIKGLVPDKFSVMSGISSKAASTSPDAFNIQATTTPGIGGNASTTAQAIGKP